MKVLAVVGGFRRAENYLTNMIHEKKHEIGKTPACTGRVLCGNKNGEHARSDTYVKCRTRM